MSNGLQRASTLDLRNPWVDALTLPEKDLVHSSREGALYETRPDDLIPILDFYAKSKYASSIFRGRFPTMSIEEKKRTWEQLDPIMESPVRNGIRHKLAKELIRKNLGEEALTQLKGLGTISKLWSTHLFVLLPEEYRKQRVVFDLIVTYVKLKGNTAHDLIPLIEGYSRHLRPPIMEFLAVTEPGQKHRILRAFYENCYSPDDDDPTDLINMIQMLQQFLSKFAARHVDNGLTCPLAEAFALLPIEDRKNENLFHFFEIFKTLKKLDADSARKIYQVYHELEAIPEESRIQVIRTLGEFCSQNKLSDSEILLLFKFQRFQCLKNTVGSESGSN